MHAVHFITPELPLRGFYCLLFRRLSTSCTQVRLMNIKTTIYLYAAIRIIILFAISMKTIKMVLLLWCGHREITGKKRF